MSAAEQSEKAATASKEESQDRSEQKTVVSPAFMTISKYVSVCWPGVCEGITDASDPMRASMPLWP